MLVVVHHGDTYLSYKSLLYLEALGGLDILEVDAAESRGDGLDHLHEALRIGLVDLNVVRINSCENLEKKRLAFHDRLGCLGADVAQSEYGGTVRYHGHKVAAPRVVE